MKVSLMRLTPSIMFIVVIFLGTTTPVFSAWANAKQDQEKVRQLEEENRKKVQEEIKKDNPITEWMSSENAYLKTLSVKGQQAFFIFRNKYSVIRAIEMVRRDVGNAVESCAKENEDMSKAMRERYKFWDNAISPIIKEAKNFMEIELKEQKSFHQSDYRHIMALNDKAYSYSEKQIQKTPVTTKEACQGLLKSMDRTEEDLINLLQDVLLPEDVIRQRAEKASSHKEDEQSKTQDSVEEKKK